jgi:hypothetical protein
MAFEVTHKGPPKKRFLFMIRRQSDGAYWTLSTGWVPEPTRNIMAEQSPGQYSFWLQSTRRDEHYEVTVWSQFTQFCLKSYVCDARGKPIEKFKGKIVNVTMVQGVLHVNGQPQTADVVYEEMSSNGITKYTAVKWKPAGITSCNCPGWTTNVRHRGKPLTERRCKHTDKLQNLTVSVYLPSQTLLPPVTPITGNTQRSGRGVELD